MSRYKQKNFSNKDKEWVYLKYGGKCNDCEKFEQGEWLLHITEGGRRLNKFYLGCNQDIHHIIPLLQGGKHIRKNFVLLCRQCYTKRHKKKGKTK